MKSKQAKAREFSAKARKEIISRDNGQCIFCNMMYKLDNADDFAKSIKSIMHYIPRSHNGLGIPQNGAIGCEYHHFMFDNGASGNREEMKQLFADYLKRHYKDWNEENLVYNKWR